MTGKRMARVLALGLVLAGAGLPAAADLKVTVEISGSIEEILPILQLLQQSGLERAAAEQMEGLKLEIQSSITDEPGAPPAEPAAPAVPQAPPQPTFVGITVTPPVAKPGEQVLFTVQVADPQAQIETLAAHSAEHGHYAFDLSDRGTQGDEVANDGVWSYLYTVPADSTEQLDFDVFAFNANAEPVQVASGSGEQAPLTTRLSVVLEPPQPEAGSPAEAIPAPPNQ